MSIAQVHNGLTLPESLRKQLLGFRRRVWLLKTAEAAAIACFGLLSAYLAVFVLDRLLDTPSWLRVSLSALACGAGCACRSMPTAGSGAGGSCRSWPVC